MGLLYINTNVTENYINSSELTFMVNCCFVPEKYVYSHFEIQIILITVRLYK